MEITFSVEIVVISTVKLSNMLFCCILLHFVMFAFLTFILLTFPFCYDIITSKDGKHMNNLKSIREIYGITQDEIATAINVNRATISNWENSDEKRASNANLEKLSLFYGIGPEYFYEQDLDDDARELLIDNAKRQRELESQNDTHLNKAEEFHQLLSSITFDEAIRDYMMAMKIFLTTLDEGSLEKLQTALIINQKMGKRLETEIDLKAKEQKANESSLSDLLDSFTTKQ